MKPARLLDDPVYGDYPALYALGIASPVKATAARRRGWPVYALTGLLLALAAAAAVALL